MRLLVCGGRDFNDPGLLERTLVDLSNQYPIDLLIHGNARGADRMARDLWEAWGRKTLPFPANWNLHGNAAGPIRNQQMIDEGNPDLVLAFPGGKGTQDMVRRARKAGIPVILIQ